MVKDVGIDTMFVMGIKNAPMVVMNGIGAIIMVKDL